MESATLNGHDLDFRIADCLSRLAAGDDAARTTILEICDERIHELSQRLLRDFASVRRWDDTNDVAQNAALRLYRALGQTVPDSPRGLMGLMATQVERELLDLARKHAGPLSYASNHGTNVLDGTSGALVFVVDETPEYATDDDLVPLERWEAFHRAVENLSADQREVFKLVWYLGADKPSVARTLGLSLRTVERRWQEARALVATALDENSAR